MTSSELLRLSRVLQLGGTAAAVVLIVLAMAFHVESWASWAILGFYLLVVCVSAWLRGRGKKLAALVSGEGLPG